MKTIARGEIWYGEICNRKKDGAALYWVDSVIVPIKNNNGQIVRLLSARIDITTHKLMDQEKSEQLKRNACLQEIRHDMDLI